MILFTKSITLKNAKIEIFEILKVKRLSYLSRDARKNKKKSSIFFQLLVHFKLLITIHALNTNESSFDPSSA